MNEKENIVVISQPMSSTERNHIDKENKAKERTKRKILSDDRTNKNKLFFSFRSHDRQCIQGS